MSKHIRIYNIVNFLALGSILQSYLHHTLYTLRASKLVLQQSSTVIFSLKRIVIDG